DHVTRVQPCALPIFEEMDRSVAAPVMKGKRLMLVLAIDKQKLEDHVGPVLTPCGQRQPREGIREGRAQSQAPMHAAVRNQLGQRLEPSASALRALQPVKARGDLARKSTHRS